MKISSSVKFAPPSSHAHDQPGGEELAARLALGWLQSCLWEPGVVFHSGKLFTCSYDIFSDP